MKKLIWIFSLVITTNLHAATLNHNTTFGFVDALLWQARAGGTDDWAQIIPPAGTSRNIQVLDVPLEWNYGVRIGIGEIFNDGAFDVVLIYTHYNTTASSQASGNVYSSFLANYFADNTNGANFGPHYHSATIRWQFFYNTADLNLGRNFIIDPVLQLHPYVGLKAASINQKIYSNWYNPIVPTNFTHATENLKNDFFGVGPMLGVDSTWPIYKCAHQSINLIGNLAAGLLWGHWNFKDAYANNAPTTITSYVDSVNGSAPVVIGVLGLQWNYQFPTSLLNIGLGYEGQAWFNQTQFYSLNMGRNNRPIYIQGGDLAFRFAFN